MTIKQALQKYRMVEIDLLLSYLLGKSKEFIFLHPEASLSAKQLIGLKKVVKRRQGGEPVAYILGRKDFYGLSFKVNKGVLIPRPETELLVESVKLKVESWGQGKIKILDVGTGSGNVIISFAKTLGPKAEYYASDISKKALAVARQNAKTNRVKVKFVQSDLLENIKGNFDIIIANLPYLSKGWGFESAGIRFEPQQALFAKEKGLKLIKRLLAQIAERKNEPKLIYLEFDPRQKKDLHQFIRKYLPLGEAKFYKDFAGHWRGAEIKI